MANSGRPLGEIETWIFDLDNTLYPASCRLFEQIEARMTAFIAERFALPREAARARQKAYFRAQGSTMRGLMLEDGVDPEEFFAYVHRIDLACLPPDPALAAALGRLPGRKIVHTNGSVRHAERVLERLAVADAFSGIFDVKAAGWEPKPALSGYLELLRRYGVVPERALMIEDMARNLAPAALLGMTTAWLRSPNDWALEGAAEPHIHYVIDDLAGFLGAASPPERK
jgi:putative hydrolase of the HAD superfamily